MTVTDTLTKNRFRSLALGAPLAFALLSLTSQAAGQECETNADCGFGFKCYSETLYIGGSSSVTGGGGSSSATLTGGGTSAGTAGAAAVCGDDLCMGSESWEACPADCERFSYCGGAECSSSADCAQGYVCELGQAGGTTGGSSGGSVSFCGDGLCDGDEDEENCAADCQQTCQMFYQLCNSDAECPSGYYCDLSQGVSTVTVSSSSGGEVFEEYDGACALDGTTGGSGGVGAGGSAGGSGDGEGDSETVGSVNTVSSTTGGSATGSGGSGGASGGAIGGASNASSASGSDGGHGHGGDVHDPWHHWRGCSVGAGQLPLGSGVPFVFVGALGWVLLRRRQP